MDVAPAKWCEHVTFEDFLEEHGRRLSRVAYLLAGTSDGAEDLMQSTLYLALRRWSWVAASATPEAYVRRIMVNAHLGGRRRRVATPVADPWGPSRPDHADSVVSRDAIWRTLATLPPRTRAVLVLRYYEDLDDLTIAEVLGVTPSTVRATVSRGLASLRQVFQSEHDQSLRRGRGY
jgi:RNA polymerase sigma-70 factor (sigma-E family)